MTETAIEFSMERGQLVGALKAVMPSASADLTRPHLAGVLLETLPDQSLARFVTTDGHRLTRLDVALHPEFEAPKAATKVLLPHDSVKGLIATLKSTARDAAHPINISIAGNGSVKFDDPCNSSSSSVQGADENFPPYDKVIPDYENKGGRGGALADVKGRLRTHDPVDDAERKRLANRLDDVTQSIGWNPAYMADVAKVAKFAASSASGGVKASFGGDRDPIRIDMENGNASAIVVIMPMRV
jgi:DNA polymerase III sliding clamp (beta) subunit (PCNA family)